MPITITSGIRTPQGYIPPIDDGEASKVAGINYHFATVAAIVTASTGAVAVERSNIAAGLPRWTNGARLTNADEPGYRVWFRSTGGTDAANAAASHARKVVFPGGGSATLAADSNVVLTTTGAPAGGTGAVGDGAFDQPAGKLYTKTGASTWDAGVSVGGGSGGTAAGIVAQTVTYGATSTIAVGTAGITVHAKLVATGDTTLAFSGTPTDLQRVSLIVLGSGGTRAVSLPGATFVIPVSSTVTSPISVASGSRTKLSFQYYADTGKWDLDSDIGGYA